MSAEDTPLYIIYVLAYSSALEVELDPELELVQLILRRELGSGFAGLLQHVDVEFVQ